GSSMDTPGPEGRLSAALASESDRLEADSSSGRESQMTTHHPIFMQLAPDFSRSFRCKARRVSYWAGRHPEEPRIAVALRNTPRTTTHDEPRQRPDEHPILHPPAPAALAVERHSGHPGNAPHTMHPAHHASRHASSTPCLTQ